MLCTTNDWEAIDRNPTGKLIWLSAIARIDDMAQEQSDCSHELSLVATDLVERDLRDINVVGRRLQMSDVKEPLQDSYFFLIEAIGRLEVACDDKDPALIELIEGCTLLACKIRKALKNGKKD